MLKRTCWVIMGVSGCGKSSFGQAFAQALPLPYAEGDDDHSAENIIKMAAGTALTDADRHHWLRLLQERIAEAKENGRGLVLSCSALKRAYRDLLRQADTDLRFIHLHGDPKVIAARMQVRQHHFMPPTLLVSQLATLEPLADDEAGMTLDISQPMQQLVELALDYARHE